MTYSDLIMALGKVIVAAAWADGQVSHEEVNSLKDLLFHLPELTINDWAQLEIYIERPIGEDERERLVMELQDAIRTEGDKAFVIRALNEIVAADGVITDSERQVVALIEESVKEANTGIINAFSRLMRGPVSRRAAAAKAPNREQFLEDFVKNKVYYEVQQELATQNISLEIPEATLRKLSLAAGLMAHVARVSPEITEGEVKGIEVALQHGWHLTPEQAMFMAKVATLEQTASLDYFRTARELVPLCTHEELAEFLDVLFEIAAADGLATREEIEEIRHIARSLLLSHEQFIESKIKVPRENRET